MNILFELINRVGFGLGLYFLMRPLLPYFLPAPRKTHLKVLDVRLFPFFAILGIVGVSLFAYYGIDKFWYVRALTPNGFRPLYFWIMFFTLYRGVWLLPFLFLKKWMKNRIFTLMLGIFFLIPIGQHVLSILILRRDYLPAKWSFKLPYQWIQTVFEIIYFLGFSLIFFFLHRWISAQKARY
jgi:hypothetical protein